MKIQGFLWSLLAAVMWGIAPLLDKMGLMKLNPIIAVLLRNILLSFIAVPVLLFMGEGRQIINVDKKAVAFTN